MTGWPGWAQWTAVVTIYSGLVWLFCRFVAGLARLQPDSTPQEGPPSDCEDPPCDPEDGWICTYHDDSRGVAAMTAAAEKWANTHG